MKRIWMNIIILMMSVIFTTSCSKTDTKDAKKNMTDIPKVKLLTSEGTMIFELDRTKAPQTVDNFLQYVKAGYYNGLTFHRVIPGFMLQGGGYSPDFKQQPTKPSIPNEADNGLKNLRGTIAMARLADPDSATSQFFINLANNDFLNYTDSTSRGWGYAVFGQVVEGMDVADKIAKQKTGQKHGHANVPVEPIVIESVDVVESS
jgi:peptidyl-prolyl cis-trans isomerase B (cyclophilin B)